MSIDPFAPAHELARAIRRKKLGSLELLEGSGRSLKLTNSLIVTPNLRDGCCKSPGECLLRTYGQGKFIRRAT